MVASAQAAATERVQCAHCSLPVPAGRVNARSEKQFCCGGCEVAHEAINACGLGEYYALRRAMEDRATPAPQAQDSFEAFDDPTFTSRHCRPGPGGVMTAELYLEGVHCAACLWLLERLPRTIDGLVSLELDFGKSVASVVWDPTRVSLGDVARRLARFGYVPHAVEPSERRDARRSEERASLVRIGVAGACAGNVMLIAFALYSGVATPIGEPYLTLFRWLSAGIGVLCVAWPGRVFFKGAVAAARARAFHLDMPIALALAVGTAVGVWNVARGAGEIYFDSLTMLVFLLLVGRFLQTRQQRMAHDSIELLFSVTPRRARRVDDDGGVRDVATDSLERGDLVEIRPGESVPVDGVIAEGEALLDESILTGESAPVIRRDGDEVFAGAVNIRSTARVRATAVGHDTRVGQMMRLIERLSRSRTPIIGSADRVAGPFVVGVLTLSILTIAIHLGSGIDVALVHAVALLIVCCPCAVAMATPIATSASIGRLAKRGILVKGGDIFEALAKRPTLLLDKTGTVTDGRFALREWIGDESLRPIVSALEAGSGHPIAASLATASDASADISDVEHHLGLGVTGRVDGDQVAIGSARLMRRLNVREPNWATAACDDAAARGLTAVRIARAGEVRAVATLGDEIREGSTRAVEELARRGWRVEILSGDAPETVRVVSDRLGVADAEGGATPERKAERASELAQCEPDGVVMVGDGVNDAAALASATVGVAVSGGAEASLAAADVYLHADGLTPLVDLASTARRTIRTIRACLGVAITYNIVAGGAAVAGLITPLIAAIVMPLVSVAVVSMAIWGTRPPRATEAPL
jgi:P-type Cu2+ transporter